MSKKLEGRDVNGMHAAPWSKLDTSAIEAPKIDISAKATSKELYTAICQAINEMLVQSVNALYGDPKQKKYVKIVDMLMMRIRGALAKISDQFQTNVDEMSDKLETMLSDLSKDFNKIIEQNNKKQNDAHIEQLKELYEAIIEKIDSTNAKNEDTSSYDKSQGIAVSQTIESSSSSSIDVSHETASSQPSTFDLLVDLQKQITDSFAKIESLITTNAVQKSAENAVDSTQKPIEQQIVNRQKSSEKEVKSQISSLNSKLGPDVKQKDVKESKESKEDKKRKKNDLKDVMTGKQFDLLKKLLTRQFNDVIDTSDIVVKKVNRGFKDINKRLDKLIKDRTKNGFSWVKLMLFASIFLFPALWAKILDFTRDVLMPAVMTAVSNFLKWIDEKFDINKKITDFIDSIDWSKHISAIGSSIWDFVSSSFQFFIADPVAAMLPLVWSTYHSLINWVTDIWNWVTGNDAEGKKAKAQKAKAEQQQIKRSEQYVDKNISRLEDKTTSKSNELESKAEQHSQSLDKSVTETQSTIQSSQKDIEKNTSSISNTIAKSDENLKKLATDASKEAMSKIDGISNNLKKSVDETTKACTDDIKRDTASIMEKMKADGAPTEFTNQQIKNVEEEVDKLPTVTQPNIETLTPVKDYVFVKNTGDKSSIGSFLTTKKDVSQSLQKIQSTGKVPTGNKTLEHLKNAVDVKQFASNAEVVENYQNTGDFDEDLKRRNIISDTMNKGNVSSQMTSETLTEREARLYADVDKAYDAVLSHADEMKNGMSKNTNMLQKLSHDVEPIFLDIKDIIKDLKKIRPIVNNSTLAIAPQQQNSNMTDAAMQ